MDFDPLPIAGFVPLVTTALPQTFGLGQIIALIFAFFALILSGFVSGSEMAYFSLTEQNLDEIEDTPKGKRIIELLKQPERLLATILIANNLVNVTIVILCNFAFGPIFTNMSPVLSFILQTILLTFLILLFGEILPKLIANARKLQWALTSIGGIKFLSTIFRPLSSLLVRSSGFVNKVVTKKTHDVTTDELEHALEITDVKTRDDKEMLEGILRFGATTVAEVMTPRVDMTDIDITANFDEVMKIVLESGYSRLPVYRHTQDTIEGILFSRDLLPFIGKADKDFNWQRLLREPYFIPESCRIDDLLEDFRKLHMHMAVVIDEFGGTQGIVTLEDVLEEIVGDINDEYDDVQKTYKKLADNTFIFEGKTFLTDFFRITGLNEEDYAEVTEDCDTLAGMLLSIRGDFPKEKEPLVYGRCRFLILEIVNHRINSVRVRVMPDVQTPLKPES